MTKGRTVKEYLDELRKQPARCLGCDKDMQLSIEPLMWVCDCGDMKFVDDGKRFLRKGIE